MRPTIWPKRPKPAMMTFGYSSTGVSKGRLVGLACLERHVVQSEQHGTQDHRGGHHQHQQLGSLRVHDSEACGEAEQHEREFAAGGQADGKTAAGARESPETRPIAHSTSDFEKPPSPNVNAMIRKGFSRTKPRLADMPTLMKNRPKQQALERFDVGLELVAEFAVGQQHAGQESAQRQRQTDLAHQQRGAQDDQQTRRGEGLRDPRCGDDAQHGPQHVAAADDHGAEHGDRA